MLHVCDIAKSSCNIHVLHESLTARPSAEQGSCSALGLFCFFFFGVGGYAYQIFFGQNNSGRDF